MANAAGQNELICVASVMTGKSHQTRNWAGPCVIISASSWRWPLSSPGCGPMEWSAEPHIYTRSSWS